MQVPILSGVYASDQANFQASYPINMEPVITETGLSKGYLRTAPGIANLTTGPGADRGAINWNTYCYRVMGSSLIRLSGSTVTNLGSVGSGGPVTMDYGFNQMAIASGGNLFYWDLATLTQVTDPDLGTVIDVMWIDGYYMTTDGSYLVVTELSDPYSVNPLKYGSSEASPDRIVALKKVRNEAYAINQYSIENFQNVGGSGFPFTRNPGGMIPKGAVGTHAVAYFLETFAFVGSAIDEAPSVYLAGNGAAISISTPQIDKELDDVQWNLRADIEVEAIIEKGEQRLYVHLPTKTLVYSHQASLAAKTPVWHILKSGPAMNERYYGRHFAYAEGKWICGFVDAGLIGYLDESIETHWDQTAGWQFDTMFLFNEGRGGILKVAELTGLPGRAPGGLDPTAFMSWTQDGQTWSQEREISTGAAGERRKRMQWRPKTRFGNYLGMRFRGANTALQGFARLDVEVEPLNV